MALETPFQFTKYATNMLCPTDLQAQDVVKTQPLRLGSLRSIKIIRIAEMKIVVMPSFHRHRYNHPPITSSDIEATTAKFPGHSHGGKLGSHNLGVESNIQTPCQSTIPKFFHFGRTGHPNIIHVTP